MARGPIGHRREVKLLRVGKETHQRLMDLGEFGDTMDKVVNKLIDFYIKNAGRAKSI
jgi:hypothetical protein